VISLVTHLVNLSFSGLNLPFLRGSFLKVQIVSLLFLLSMLTVFITNFYQVAPICSYSLKRSSIAFPVFSQDFLIVSSNSFNFSRSWLVVASLL
jgi:hypothetical protein